MQFFFRGLLVAAITYFLKLGHNNHGLHIYYSDHGPPMGRRNNGPSTGRRNNGPSTGHRTNGPSMGRMYDRLAKHGPIMDCTMGHKRARVGIIRSWADHNGSSLIGSI